MPLSYVPGLEEELIQRISTGEMAGSSSLTFLLITNQPRILMLGVSTHPPTSLHEHPEFFCNHALTNACSLNFLGAEDPKTRKPWSLHSLLNTPPPVPPLPSCLWFCI